MQRMVNIAAGRTTEQWAFGFLLATVFSITFSIALGQFFAGLCGAAFIAALIMRQFRLRIPALMWLALAFAVVAVLTTLFGLDSHDLWRKTSKLLWFLLIPVTASLVTTPQRISKLVWAFVWGCGTLAVHVCVWNPYEAWRTPVPDYRTALLNLGSMTEAQMLMLGVVAIMVLLLGLVSQDTVRRRCLVALLVLTVLALLITFKRGAWFCATLLAALVAVLRPGLRWPSAAALLALLVVVLGITPLRARLGQLRSELNLDGGGRLTMWFQVVPKLIKEQPLGVGYGTLSNRMMRYASKNVEPNRTHLHSNIAQVLVETGWLGLALYSAWMLWALAALSRWWRQSRDGPPLALACLCMFAGLLLNGLVEYNFGDTELMIIYAVLMGVAGRTKTEESAP